MEKFYMCGNCRRGTIHRQIYICSECASISGEAAPSASDNTGMDVIALLNEAQMILDGVNGFKGRGRLMEIIAAVLAQQHHA